MYMSTERREDRSGLGKVGLFGSWALAPSCYSSSCVRFVCSGEDGFDNPALVMPDFVCLLAGRNGSCLWCPVDCSVSARAT